MPKSPQDEVTEVVARCHCGQLSASATIHNSDLPLNWYICSCSGCRKLSGHLGITFARIPEGSARLQITGDVSRYKSPGGAVETDRCFCGTCGAAVYEEVPDEDEQGLCTGSIINAPDLIKFAGHEYTWWANDGGLAVFLPDSTIWDGGTDQPPIKGNPYALRISKEIPPCKDDRIEASCSCRGVRFFVTKPNDESFSFAWPEEHLGRWTNKSKYMAKFCVCDSCRRTSGYHVVPWAFVPHVNILDPDTNKQYDFDTGTLKSYRSSKDVTRHFCGRCGATVFFRWAGRKNVVDICVGLLAGKKGARVEEWLDWQDGLSFAEDAKDQEIVQLILNGMERRKERADANRSC